MTHSEVARTCCVRWYVRPSRFAKKKLTSYIEHWKKLLAFLLCLKKVGQTGPCWVCWGSSFLDQNQLTNIAPGSNEAPPPWQIGAVEYHPWTILGSTNHFVSRNMSCYFNYFYFVHRIISDRSKKKTPLEVVHPGSLTWNQRMYPWKRKIIFQTIILRFYVNFPGCIQKNQKNAHTSTWNPRQPM